MEAEIRGAIPSIDPVLTEYSAGYLQHAANSYNPDEGSSALAEAEASISQLLISASGDPSEKNEEKLKQLVQKWVEKLSAASAANIDLNRVSGAARRLDQAIQVSAQRNMSSTLGISTTGVDLESANVRKVESKVDRKKLEKAERKIAAKQNKKEFKAVEYEASKLLKQPDDTQSYEEFFMQVNPLQLGSNAMGQQKSKDIKVEGIDVTIGGLRILTDTNLTLAYGRRYGLVGQNGIGKSTLLRALARRELAIPVHISILHVEQEVRIHKNHTQTLQVLTGTRSLETILQPFKQCLMLMFGESISCRSKRSLPSSWQPWRRSALQWQIPLLMPKD